MKLPKLLKNMFRYRLAKLVTLGAMSAITAMVSQAGVAPYTPDANTLHLWHFDETGGSLCYDAVTNNPQTMSLTVSNTPGINAFGVATDTYFAQLDQPGALPIFTNSIVTTQYSCFYMPWYATNGQAYPITTYTNISNYANTNTGAFTMEALVRPLTSLLSSSPTANPEILCGDNGGNVTTPPVSRGWQWRFDCGAPSAGAAELEFNDINCPGTNHDLIAHLPVTGPDAVILGNWYHVAVAYTGSTPTNGDPAHMLTLYWTLLDPTRTNGTADVLTNFNLAFTYTNASGAGMLNWSPNTLTTGLYPTNSLHGTPFFVVGGSGRNNLSNDVASAGGFDGLIDEVRVSEVYRHSNEFLFNTKPLDQSPGFTVEPAASTLLAYGQTLTLAPTVIGTAPLHFQWTQNGTVLPGQTNVTLVISNVTFSADGNYQCFVTNTTATYGTVGTTSTIAAVTVGAAFQDLFNTGVDANGNPLDQTAPGSVDLHYSLTQNPDSTTVSPHAIVWGDQSPVQPNGVLPPNGAAVWIGPEENAGTVTGTYTYQTTFQIDEAIPGTAALSGSLVASGPSSSSVVQAFVNGVETDIPLSAANPAEYGSSFVISNGLMAGSNVLTFTMACTGAGGGAIGLHAQISGLGLPLPAGLPVISSQPVSQTVPYGSTAGLAVLALGQPPLSYQWYSNGIAISPATLPTAGTSGLSFPATNINTAFLDGSGNFDANYQVVISNNSGSVTSSVVTLTIANLAPQVAAAPAISTNTMTLFAGASATFSVSPAGGVQPYDYQWYSNGVAVADTTAAYEVTNLAAGALGYVDCVISNAAAAVTNLWSLSVIAPPTAPYPLAVLAANPIGYWRLNEAPDNGLGNDGFICNDYVGGHAGAYTNVNLAEAGYNPTTDPTETSTLFGETGISFYDSYAGQIAGIDFATPTNKSATFTIEAWVNGFAGAQPNGAGLVSKGYGNGGEQFDLDVYGGAYRFFVRDVSGTVHGPTVANKVDGSWHHLVGVCDEVNSNISLYVDGALAGRSAVAPGVGILEATNLMCIGSRSSSATTNNNFQFYGYLDDVAVYNYALSASQVIAQYVSQGASPAFVQQPSTNYLTLNAGSTLVLPASLVGTGPMTYEWFDENGGTNITSGSTNTDILNANLTVSNVPAAWNNDTLELSVANTYGSTNLYISLNVISGLQASLNPADASVLAGQSYTATVQAAGQVPLYYQWYNGSLGTPLVNATNASFTAVAALGNSTYICQVSNAFDGLTVSNVTLTLTGLPYLTFNESGAGWTGEQSGSYANTPVAFNNGVLTLTDGLNSEARSEFYGGLQYVGSFVASFTYQFTAGSTATPADGVAFVLQNDSRGAAATGAGGGNLGVGVISPSVELELNVYPSAAGGVGYSVNTNGVIGPNTSLGPISLTSGDPINITAYYAKGQPLSLTFTDAVAGTAFSTNINVGNLTNLVHGSSAYVGFTGGTGGDNAVQTIANFSFISLPQETLQLTATNTVAISWPAAIGGYVVQQNLDLTTTNWVNVTNPAGVVNGQNQVIVPVNGSNAFYRLFLP